MKNETQTKGTANGYNVHRRPTPRKQGRGSKDFLQQPCNDFKMPKKRSNRAGAVRAVACQRRDKRSDKDIIAQRSMPARIVISTIAVLTVSGILPVALVALQTWLCDTYGILAFMACTAVEVAVIWYMVRYV